MDVSTRDSTIYEARDVVGATYGAFGLRGGGHGGARSLGRLLVLSFAADRTGPIRFAHSVATHPKCRFVLLRKALW